MRVLSLILLVILLGAPGCRRDGRPELCRLDHFVDFTIQPGLNTFETHIYQVSPLASVLDANLSARGYSRADVDAIVPQSAILRGVFQDVDLDFIHRVSVRVFDPFDPGNNLEFFYLDPVPFRNKTAIQLFPGIADVTQWFDAPYFGVESRLDFRQVTPTLVPMRLEFTMRVLGKE